MPTQISGTTGVSLVQDGVIVDADINSAANINGSKIAAGTVGTAQLSANSIPVILGNQVGAFSFRNKIINGGMQIDQRNDGAAITSTVAGTLLYPVDRFFVFANSANPFSITAQRITDTSNPEFQSYFRTTTNTAWNYTGTVAENGQYAIQHRIEGNNVRDFRFGTPQAKTFTLSFWVRSNYTGTYLMSFVGKTPFLRVYYDTYEINQANTWEKKTITVPGDTTVSSGVWDTGIDHGIIIIWGLGSSALVYGSGIGLNAWSTRGSGFSDPRLSSSIGSTFQTLNNKAGATFDLTGVQLEEGPIATPFEHRPITTELTLCQRYYERLRGAFIQGPGIGGATTAANWIFKVTKRTSPACTGGFPSSTGNQIGPDNAYVQNTGANAIWNQDSTASAEL